MQHLPIDDILPEVVTQIARRPALVVEAAPGAGKTTRLPLALLRSGSLGDREILVLEPRRLAARLAARYVAELEGSALGERVGYQVRFENVTSSRTRLTFITEALLLRQLVEDPALARIGAVVFDEFHERHLVTDLGLSLVRALAAGKRPDLKIVVMSATLAAAPIAAFLDDAPVLSTSGREYPITIEHLELPDPRPLAQQVASALRRLVARGLDGHVLVFLPGAAEIRRAAQACAEIAASAGVTVHTLHGDLPPAEQDRAVRPSAGKKLILSTNVAETSVTIAGVTAVIDSGLARVASHNPWSGLPVLRVRPVSRAAATQRAGRAGREAPGLVLRLYTKHDFETRPAFELPEIRRTDLSEAMLYLAALGHPDIASLRWLDAPPADAVAAARDLLARLGAIDAGGLVTPLGRDLLRFPVHPRLARLIVAAAREGEATLGCVAAALLAERDISTARGESARVSGACDVTALSETFLEVRAQRFAASALTQRALNPGAVHAVERAARQLEGLARGLRRGTPAKEPEVTLRRALLSAYPDRVAQRVKSAGRDAGELLLAQGGRARLAESSSVRDARLLVAVDAEESGGAAAARLPLVRIASAADADWLLDLPHGLLEETSALVWNESAERVERLERLSYGAITLDETRRTDCEGDEVAALLAKEALAAGLKRFVGGEALDRFIARIEFARSSGLGLELPAVDEAGLAELLTRACQGRRSFAELERASLLEEIEGLLEAKARRELARFAPERIELPHGRKLAVQYERGKPPWVASRLQDFFGMGVGPVIAGGRVSLTLHLLAPNSRPVQVTTDLAGFWERHYPELRRALSRRYPRHAWPEDPRRAAPPQRGR